MFRTGYLAAGAAALGAMALLVPPAVGAPGLAGVKIRPGHWKQVSGDDFDPADPTMLCLSGKGPVLGPSTGSCPGLKITSAPGRVQIDGACQIRQARMTIHGVATGDFQTSYKGDLTMDIVGRPGAPPMHNHVRSEYRWVGPCAPGEPPDDR